MEGYKQREMQGVAEATAARHLPVYYAQQTWQSPDGKRKGWKIIIEHDLNGRLQLEWVNTYDEELTKPGTHLMEFYRNTQGRCVRKPRKD